MKLPDWADENLSKELPILRSQGESQHLEYIEKFPENTRELAREIAAFATSNDGTILIGVSDQGDLIGLPGLELPEGRDTLIRRLEGICKGVVKPSITPKAAYAIESEKIVLVLSIPKGRQPVYYHQHTPYLRHLREARPAEPHEVIELISDQIRSSAQITSEAKKSEEQQFYEILAPILIDILIQADEASDREFNPWLDMWRSDFGYAASQLRNLSAEGIAIKEGLNESLSQLANDLEKVTSHRLYLGCDPELRRLTAQVAERASQIKRERMDIIPLSQESLDQVNETLKVTARKLDNLASRSTDLINSGRIEELQTEASGLGQTILQLSHYNITLPEGHLPTELRDIGRQLHLVEIMRLVMDGGKSLNNILDTISQNSERLSSIVAKL